MRFVISTLRFHHFNLKYIAYFFGENFSLHVKHWIDVNYKLIEAESRLRFLKRCRANTVFPAHLKNVVNFNFHLHHFKAWRKLDKICLRFKEDILKCEIFDIHRSVHQYRKLAQNYFHYIYNCLPGSVFDGLMTFHLRSFDRCWSRLNRSYNKKINWLTSANEYGELRKIKPIRLNNNYTMRTATSKEIVESNIISPVEFYKKRNDCLEKTNKKWFLNLTDSIIPEDVSKLLQLGENFSVPVVFDKRFTIHEFIKDLESGSQRHQLKNQTTLRNFVIPELHKYLDNKCFNRMEIRFNKLLCATRKFCKLNPDILFTRADKGNVTVALNKGDYDNKVMELLSDRDTYEIIRKDPSLSIERKLNACLKRWTEKGYIDHIERLQLRSNDTSLPRAYGLPKIHKDGTPFRLIVSTTNTALYALATFLSSIISKSIPPANSYISNSFSLYKILAEKTINDSDILISLDVISLFTNVPFDLAIEGIKRRWINIQKLTKIPEDEFITAVEFVLHSTFFKFNGVIYKQNFGTPMGSPISPILADLVMRDLEESVLKKIQSPIGFYYRYVDDILLSAPVESIEEILENFNSFHGRLQFTMELESEQTISFLDLKLINRDNKITMDWYHKETFSGRYLSFFSNHPISHKIGNIYGLVDRALLLSHPSFHRKNIMVCIELLIENGYPIELIFKEINKRIKFNSNKNNATNDSGGDDSKSEKKYFVFPFINPVSKTISSRLDRSCFSMGHRPLNKLSSVIKAQKDKTEKFSRNNVVYRINCRDCDASYVGQTKRKLGTRIKEHKNNIKLDPTKHSVITQHMVDMDHEFDWENVTICDTEMYLGKRLISEMIHIKEQHNGLNSQKDTEFLDSSYFDLLNCLKTYPSK